MPKIVTFFCYLYILVLSPLCIFFSIFVFSTISFISFVSCLQPSSQTHIKTISALMLLLPDTFLDIYSHNLFNDFCFDIHFDIVFLIFVYFVIDVSCSQIFIFISTILFFPYVYLVLADPLRYC